MNKVIFLFLRKIDYNRIGFTSDQTKFIKYHSYLYFHSNNG